MFPRINTALKQKKYDYDYDYDYKMMFDGCSKGNPGLSGAGSVIYFNSVEIWSGDLFVGERFTNNYAEYIGLIYGLEQALNLGIKTLKVEGDSLLVINQMKGLYSCKSLNLLELYEKSKKLEKEFDKIEYVHVLRNLNKKADALSNIAIDKYLFEIENR